MEYDNSSDELLIAYLFPPSKDVSGMVAAKRCMVEGKCVDVIQTEVKKGGDHEFLKCLDGHVNDTIVIDNDCNYDFPDCIFGFVSKSLDELEKRNTYKKIYSRAFQMANNFLAYEYKLLHPETYWVAEFSDPIFYTIYGDIRDFNKDKFVKDEEYLERVNETISQFNKSNGTDFEHVRNPTNIHFLVEYIAYIFADEVVFTNENQRDVMLDLFPVDVKDFVMKKSKVKAHPIIAKEYYHINDFKDDLDSSKINVGYFGTYLSKRHFEAVFNAFEMLNHKHKDRFAFHFYITNKSIFRQLTRGFEISNNIIIKNPISYLDFLNLTTKLDVLLINDLVTEGCFDVNPFRPSKLSDYMGSGSKIWGICEKGSPLDQTDIDYKSYMNDSKSNADAMVEMLKDFSYDDEEFFTSDGDRILLKRVTDLNRIIDQRYRKQQSLQAELKDLKKENEKLKKENVELKNTNEEILSSNSWKYTGYLRKIRNIKK